HRLCFWQYHAIPQHLVLSLLLCVSAFAPGCAYPARQPPEAWAKVDRDKPTRAPDVPYEPSSQQAIDAMIELGAPGP
ncbi:hypothetical protein, partial [Aliarcobacter cryaerophilus]|uniref:hypothetical protein n=1 Tax=Aliarcobacter cryaerophilus TaxID=28198 RepID=UPI001CA357A8